MTIVEAARAVTGGVDSGGAKAFKNMPGLKLLSKILRSLQRGATIDSMPDSADLPSRSRMPAVRKLASQILGQRRGSQIVGDSSRFLGVKRARLAEFGSVESLAISASPETCLPGTTPGDIDDARELAHHLTTLRNALAEELWSRELLIDAQILDELIYWAAIERPSLDPVLASLEWIRDNRAARPGLLIFPLHSLGVMGAGLIRPSVDRRLEFLNPKFGYALSPQTNSMDKTLSFLEDARHLFGVRKQLPEELIRHWRRSRPTSWLERNPLLVVRTNHLPGSYYGNEWYLISRIRTTTAMLSMLAALQPQPSDRPGLLFSTRSMNNFQTLDIHHYITLFDDPLRRGGLEGYCVPIHAARTAVSELSDLDIEIDPTHWGRQKVIAELVHRSVETVYSDWLSQRTRTSNRKADARSRTTRKLFESLSFFRQSTHRSIGVWTAQVGLSTAFEMLLTDSYGRGVTNTLQRRTQLLLRGVPGTLAMQQVVGDLYNARSSVVHSGNDEDVDMHLARRTFVMCFIAIVERLPSLSPSSSTPIGDLTGDT